MGDLGVLVTILKVVSPSHFIIRENEDERNQSPEKFIVLERVIQELYSKYDIQPEFPEFPAKGEIIIVKDEKDNAWYRARVEAVIETSKGARISVYLVDYGQLITVRKEWVRKMRPEMLKVPFQAVEFLLYGLQPLTLDLEVDSADLRAHYRIAQRWDTAAVEFVRDLLAVSSDVKVSGIVVDIQGKQYGELLVCNGDDVASLNELLIKSRYAVFSQDAVKNIVPLSEQKKQEILQRALPTETRGHQQIKGRERPGSESDSGMTLEECIRLKQKRRKEVIDDILDSRKRISGREETKETTVPSPLGEPIKPPLGRGFIPVKSSSSSMLCKSNPTYTLSRQTLNDDAAPETRLQVGKCNTMSSDDGSCRSRARSSTNESICLDANMLKIISSSAFNSKESVSSSPDSRQNELLKKLMARKAQKSVSKTTTVPINEVIESKKIITLSDLQQIQRVKRLQALKSQKSVPVNEDRKGEDSTLLDSKHNEELRPLLVSKPLLEQCFPDTEVNKKGESVTSLDSKHDKHLGRLLASNVQKPLLERCVSVDEVCKKHHADSEQSEQLKRLRDLAARKPVFKSSCTVNEVNGMEKAEAPSVSGKGEQLRRMLTLKAKESVSERLNVFVNGVNRNVTSSDSEQGEHLRRIPELRTFESTLKRTNVFASETNKRDELDDEQNGYLSKSLLTRETSVLIDGRTAGQTMPEVENTKSSSDCSVSLKDRSKTSDCVQDKILSGTSSLSRSELFKLLLSKTQKRQLPKAVCDRPPLLESCQSSQELIYLEKSPSRLANVSLESSKTPERLLPTEDLPIVMDSPTNCDNVSVENGKECKRSQSEESKSFNKSVDFRLLKLLAIRSERLSNQQFQNGSTSENSVTSTKLVLSDTNPVTERLSSVCDSTSTVDRSALKISNQNSLESVVGKICKSQTKRSPTVAQKLLKSFQKLPQSESEKQRKNDEFSKIAKDKERLEQYRKSEDEFADSNLDTTLNMSLVSDSAESYSDQLDTIYEKFSSTAKKNFFKIDGDFLQDYMQGCNILTALTHGIGAPKPIFQKENAPFVSAIHKRLEELNFTRPTVVQAYMWPAVCSGRSAVVVSPPHSGKSLAHILPLMSSIMEAVSYEDLPTGCGPLVLMLSSSWSGCQALYNQCQLLMPKDRKIRVLVVYGGGSEKTQQISLINGCDILISTPSCFLRILVEGCLKFTNLDRCCHLVLDDGDILTDFLTEEVKRILLEYASAMKKRRQCSVPNQIILCCQHWTKGVESFVGLIMNEPLVFITSFLEGAVYSRIPLIAHSCLTTNQNKTLVSLIENSPKQRKIIVCTRMAEKAAFVKDLLQNASIYALLAHESMPHFKLQEVKEQWSSSHTSAVMVVTDPVLYQMHVTDADVLVHYDFPEFSKGRFSGRFGYLFDSFQPVPAMLKDGMSFQNKSVCHLLITEECQRQASELTKLLLRTGSQVPRSLIAESKNHKMTKPLCYKMKAFGVCERELWCSNRHFVTADHEQPQVTLPDGEVRVFVMYVVNATHYYVRLLDVYDPETKATASLNDTYFRISFNLAKHYAQKSNRIPVQNPQPGDICGLESKMRTFHRVVIEELEDQKENNMAVRYKVRFLDEGWHEFVYSWNLLQLPEDISKEEPQAYEVFLCKLKPVDGDTQWTIQADTYVHSLIYKKEMVAKVALCLDRTLWLSTLVLRERLLAENAFVNSFSVGGKLVKNGFAVRNPEHIDMLRKACQGKIVFPEPLKVKQSPKVNLRMQNLKPIKRCTTGQHSELIGSGPFAVFVSAIQTPELFFVHQTNFEQSLTSLTKEISQLVNEGKLEPVSDVTVGMLCIAPLTDDEDMWYRARVTSANSSDKGVLYGLFFLDFGDEGTAGQKDLYRMTEELLQLPFQAIECSLEGIAPVHGGWSNAVSEKFYDLSRDDENFYHELTLGIVRESSAGLFGNRHYTVHLWHQNESIAQKLVTVGLCQASTTLSNSPSRLEGRDQDSLEEIASSSGSDTSIEIQAHEANFYLNLLMANSARRLALPRNVSSDETTDGCRKITKVLSGNDKNNEPQQVAVASVSVPECQPCLEAVDGSLIRQFPHLTWWQTKKAVFIAIEVPCEEKEYTIHYSTDGLSFFTKSSTKCYAMDVKLYDSIDPEKSFGNSHSRSVDVCLKKIKKVVWPRLFAEKVKNPYVKYDFDHLCLSSDRESSSDGESYPKEKCPPSEVLPYDPDDELDAHDNDDSEDDYFVRDETLPVTEDPYNYFT